MKKKKSSFLKMYCFKFSCTVIIYNVYLFSVGLKGKKKTKSRTIKRSLVILLESH